MLEWVYGCIVSTAEKARDASQRSLSFSPLTVERAWEGLRGALEDQIGWVGLMRGLEALSAELQAADQWLTEEKGRREAVLRDMVQTGQQHSESASLTLSGWESSPSDGVSQDGQPPSTSQTGWACDAFILASLDQRATTLAAEAHLQRCCVAFAERSLQSVNSKLSVVSALRNPSVMYESQTQFRLPGNLIPPSQNEPRVGRLRVQVEEFHRELSSPAAYIAEANKRGTTAGAREAAAKQLERCLQVGHSNLR